MPYCSKREPYSKSLNLAILFYSNRKQLILSSYCVIRHIGEKFIIVGQSLTRIIASKPAFTSSKLTIETLEKEVKYVQS